jgi:hypothetical protein
MRRMRVGMSLLVVTPAMLGLKTVMPGVEETPHKTGPHKTRTRVEGMTVALKMQGTMAEAMKEGTTQALRTRTRTREEMKGAMVGIG